MQLKDIVYKPPTTTAATAAASSSKDSASTPLMDMNGIEVPVEVLR